MGVSPNETILDHITEIGSKLVTNMLDCGRQRQASDAGGKKNQETH
jgi:hypothetical protein